jgi:hypothetical protein
LPSSDDDAKKQKNEEEGGGRRGRVVGECTNSYYSSQWACHDINITKIEQKHKQKRKSIH